MPAFGDARVEPALSLRAVGKRYRLYRSDLDRLLEMVTGKPRHEDVAALSDINLSIWHGEVLGIVGCNGAGKSTLLKLIAGMLPASEGEIDIHGRVGAILELGAAFHPEMSGRENVYLKAAIAGLTRAEIDALVPEIAAFADIGAFMERPVKTYSSGMSARLAFAAATAIDPDILIIDEALSVGDGAFARKSFDRIMAFRDAGKTILFCSHSHYHIQSICNRALWLDQGRVRMLGAPMETLAYYREHLESSAAVSQAAEAPSPVEQGSAQNVIESVRLGADGREGHPVSIYSGRTDLAIRICFRMAADMPPPSVGVTLMTADHRPIAGATSLRDGVALHKDADGRGEALVIFPRLPLLSGRYMVIVFLLCERGLHIYDQARISNAVSVEDDGLEAGIGLVELARKWQVSAADDALNH